jgi:carboxypeptidase C (cathepsin A)
MEGVLQETGPCYFVDYNATTPVNNPYSWNEYANMLYVDEPTGVGFSYGTDSANSSHTAAAYVWNFLQAWYDRFPEYKNREFGLFTESYGGHIGPTFVDYFQSKNAEIKNGSIKGINIPVVALGINNGALDPVGQYGSYADFGYNNSYKQLIDHTTYVEFKHNYTISCGPALAKCASTNTTADCVDALTLCNYYESGWLNLLVDENINWYDIRYPGDDLGLIPPQNWVDYLLQSNILKAIGAKSDFVFCSDGNILFDATGDGKLVFLFYAFC